MNGHAPPQIAAANNSSNTAPTTDLTAPPLALPLIFDPISDGDDDAFIITTPKGGCSITYDREELLPAVANFSSDMFDMTSHRCHPYSGRPKGDPGPSGKGWTGFYARVAPVPGLRHFTEQEDQGRGWSMEVQENPVEGLKVGLVVTGTDAHAVYSALALFKISMGLSPWQRWKSERSPWRPHVAWKRKERAQGHLPPLGQVFDLSVVTPEEWERLVGVAEDRDAEENLANIIWTAIHLGKDVISYEVMEKLGIAEHMNQETIERECQKRLVSLTGAPQAAA